MNNKTTHLINILTQLLESKKLSSIDIRASNSNQYFVLSKTMVLN